MAFSHGKDAVVKFGTVGVPGTATDISQYVTSVALPRAADVAETSTLGDASKNYIAGMKDGTVTVEGRFDPTVDTHLAGILGVNGIAFEVGPAGSGSGSPKYTGTCICQSYEVSMDVGDAVGFSADFQISGDVTRGTY